MLSKSDPDTIQAFLTDASYMSKGHADRVVFPQNADEVSDVLREATKAKTPVTVSGAGTGTVGGRVPAEGIVLATDKLDQIKSMGRNDSDSGGRAVAESGVRIADLQRFVATEGFFYAPDPTERSCFLGGTVATNASGARTFKYGPTRNHILRLQVALANGEVIDLRRGDLTATQDGRVSVPLPNGHSIEAQLPSYQMPKTRKHAAGYFVAPGMDLIDLFIGSEGTLGVVIEVEVALLPRPKSMLSGVVFFEDEKSLLAFVAEARSTSIGNRADVQRRGWGTMIEKAMEITDRGGPVKREVGIDDVSLLDARALEYFDRESLNFLRTKYSTVPEVAAGAIFFEQETTSETEDALMQEWLVLIEKHAAMSDASWFATNDADYGKLREFRHALPVLMNEWFSSHHQRKVSTDMSVPDEVFPEMLRFYQDTLRATELRHTVFGHIGDNHVHVNILPRNDIEAAAAREIYQRFVQRAVAVGGTISAEHGIGKLKRDYLKVMYSEKHLREMAALKKAFDPAGILGRGNMFAEEYL